MTISKELTEAIQDIKKFREKICKGDPNSKTDKAKNEVDSKKPSPITVP